MKIIKEIILIIILTFCAVMACSAQIYYGDLTENNYHRILSGNWFFPATIELLDSTTHECYIARYANSDKIRIKPFNDTTQIIVLNHKYVKSFTYHLLDTNATHIYLDIDRKKHKSKIRPVEVIDTGRISVYVYRWIEVPDINYLPYSKSVYHKIYAQFYLKKDDDILHKINDFSHDIKFFIKDNDDIYQLFRKNKIYKEDGFAAYLSIIKLYNLYDKK